MSSVCQTFVIKAPFPFPMVTVSKAGSVMTWAPGLGSSLNGRGVVSRPLASGSEGGWRVLCALRMITEATRRLTTEQGSGMDHPESSGLVPRGQTTCGMCTCIIAGKLQVKYKILDYLITYH